MSSLFDQPQYTESELQAMGNHSLRDGLPLTSEIQRDTSYEAVKIMNETQKEIQRRLERNETPEFIAQEMGIPKSHIILLKK